MTPGVIEGPRIDLEKHTGCRVEAGRLYQAEGPAWTKALREAPPPMAAQLPPRLPRP